MRRNLLYFDHDIWLYSIIYDYVVIPEVGKSRNFPLEIALRED